MKIMATLAGNSAQKSQGGQLSFPSTRAGAAAYPVAELAKDDPRIVVTGDLRGPYERSGANQPELHKTVSAPGDAKLAIDALSSSNSGTSRGGFRAAEADNEPSMEHRGRETENAVTASSAPLAQVKPIFDTVESTLYDIASTASTYLPSSETQQQALEATRDTLATTASAAVAGASLAGEAISTQAQAAFRAIEPLLPHSGTERNVVDDLDDLVTRAAEAKEPVNSSANAVL